MKEFDLREIWRIASSTLNKKLVKACGSQVGRDYSKMEQPEALFEQTTVDGMRALLQLNKFNPAFAQETKLRVLRSWLLSSNPHTPRSIREGVFDELLSYIKLSGVSSDTVLQITEGLPPNLV